MAFPDDETTTDRVDTPVEDPTAPDEVEADESPQAVDPADPEAHADLVADSVDADSVDAASDPDAAVDPDGVPQQDSDARARRNALLAGGLILVILVAAAVLFLAGDDEEATELDDVTAGAAADVPSGPDAPAYSLYGEEVGREELQSQLEDMVGPDLVEAAGSIEEANPEERSRIAEVMSTLITERVMARAAEQEGISVTQDEVESQVSELIAQGFGGDEAAFEQAIAESGVTMGTVHSQFRTALLAEQLVAGETEEVDAAAVQAFYDQQFGAPIVSHILVETEEEAQAAIDRIEGDEAFPAVAADVSTDASAQQGGRLGPLQEGQFVEPFTEAATALEIGEVSEPVETEFGWHVITVEEPPALEEVEADIRTALEDQSLNTQFAELAQRLDAQADIAVDPAYGTWDGLAGGGLIPTGADPPEQPVVPLPEDTEGG